MRYLNQRPNLISLFIPVYFSSTVAKGEENFLRKKRKWPLAQYKAIWYETVNQQEALQTLIQSPNLSINPLQALKDSFALYNCDLIPEAYNFIIRTLVENNSHRHHLPVVLRHLEQQPHKFKSLPEHVFIHLIKKYGDADLVEEAVDVFVRMPGFRCVPTVDSLNSLLVILCKKKECVGKVPELLLQSVEMGIRLEESSYRILIAGLCRLKKFKYAIKIVYCMLNDNGPCVLDGKLCSLIVSRISNRGDLNSGEFLSFLEERRSYEYVPNEKDAANVIKFLVKEGRTKSALDVLNQLKTDRIKPDIVCYTMALKGVVLAGDYDRAEALFDEIILLGLVPNVDIYNVYIHGLCKQGKAGDGYGMIALMEEVGCKADSVTYNTILDSFCKIGEMERAREIVSEMQLKNVLVNLSTHRIILDGLIGNSEISEACCHFEEMLDAGLWPRSTTTEEIACKLCKVRLISVALRLCERILEKAIVPGPRALEALLLSRPGSKCNFMEISLTNLVNSA